MLWSVISVVERAFHRFLNRPGSRDPGPGRLGGFQSAETYIALSAGSIYVQLRLLGCSLACAIFGHGLGL